ncbi:riboflavin synthase [Sphingomonas sp. CGMCC 1.13654]|uniref:Riboflavin synthase n=1 Tax=Sphingomonas chungangi TaxID=2683589 RepID=A0A838L9N4_9SPHN|nr:riboflavin synthase [Sphingomonas chungangi]MBA2935425.1 riboflavin synthase [Sphingomonas chungangi]MVW56932.1 riboflavin synthase [Sphingomonas chungangi]
MFTGIITDIGTVRSIEQRGDLRLVIDSGYDMGGVDLGASIACSGACLTVVDKAPAGEKGWFAVDVSHETVSRTAPGLFAEGARLNLERALKVGDELGGHIVTGHVDGIGTLVSAEPDGDSIRIVVEAPASLAPYLVAKGSITVDGVSLTVNSAEDVAGGACRFGINIIPHTQQLTTLDALEPGRRFNLEIDILARYLGRMEQLRK